MCIDYRALNKLTIKNKYPIPLIADLFDQLGGARWFTKLDLRSRYYQVRIVEESTIEKRVLFHKKHDGSLRMCIDYRALNKLTIKNKYPIPLIADLFDQLGGAWWFTKLDWRSRYYQVRIVEESTIEKRVLFHKKHDGSLRMCIDYQALKKLTIKNKYPIPLIADLFDQLGGARWFTKLNLRSRYYQVRIAAGNKPKIACVTRYGSYELLSMPFGVTNSLATFYTLMNKVLQPFLDQFIVVYLDDIVIYSKTLVEHVEHLRQVFEVLRQNKLYVKKEKCLFSQKEVPFLDHIVGGGKIRMDGAKA
ncbi:hypothetical protein V6N12_068492 [Hibiscus sabdariffa]|uniref:Reverse transcriptase domain-containing protein n=1 Tax=Hibiscus sabdariffa TaxID=183260 RepID=A0ABR2FQ51_9ROSI